ncbi:uncharacterized protein [Lolium perenne]|uniref:uncharacterized protein n=1 Tax=Lolium perenne TaxID=4522 RepID=UPI003A99C86D
MSLNSKLLPPSPVVTVSPGAGRGCVFIFYPKCGHGNHISPPPTTHHRPTREAAAPLACSPAPACIGLSVRVAPSSSPDRVVSVAGSCTAVLHDGGGLPATMTRRRRRAVVRHLTRSRAEAGEASSGEGSVLGVSSGVLAGNGDPRRAQLQGFPAHRDSDLGDTGSSSLMNTPAPFSLFIRAANIQLQCSRP